MRIELTDYNTTPESIIRIYRSYQPFTTTQLPEVLVTLPYDATVWEDHTVDLNEVVYYRVSVVHNDVEIVGSMYTTIKRYYTGPQLSVELPDTILRGDSKVGRYGTFKPDKVATIGAILTALPNAILLNGVNAADLEYEKCIYNGHVLFLPTFPFINASPEGMYNSKALYAYGDGKANLRSVFYDTITNKVMQGNYITSAGNTYKIRVITQPEYDELHNALYPTSAVGSELTRAIGNCNSYPQQVYSASTSATQGDTFVVNSLDGTSTTRGWSELGPTYVVLELMGRSELIYPIPDVVDKPQPGITAVFRPTGIAVGNRIHWLSGMTTWNTTTASYIGQHFSIDLTGNDYKLLAPIPTPVIRPAVWEYQSKLYVFGGITAYGKDSNTWATITSILQVWEDDGSAGGVWSTIPTNMLYSPGAVAAMLTNPITNSVALYILGADNSNDPSGLDGKQAWMVSLPDNDFTNATPLTVNSSFPLGGSALFEWHGKVWAIGGGVGATSISSFINHINLPTVAGAPITYTRLATQGSAMPSSNYASIGIWHDTVFSSLNGANSTTEDGKSAIYQMNESDRRWMQIPVEDLPVSSYLYPVWKDNKMYAFYCNYMTSNAPTGFVVLTLTDPLELPIQSISKVKEIVGRWYQHYALPT